MTLFCLAVIFEGHVRFGGLCSSRVGFFAVSMEALGPPAWCFPLPPPAPSNRKKPRPFFLPCSFGL